MPSAPYAHAAHSTRIDSRSDTTGNSRSSTGGSGLDVHICRHVGGGGQGVKEGVEVINVEAQQGVVIIMHGWLV